MSKLGDALKASNKQAAIDKINSISDGDWKKESDAAVKELGGKQTSTTSNHHHLPHLLLVLLT